MVPQQSEVPVAAACSAPQQIEALSSPRMRRGAATPDEAAAKKDTRLIHPFRIPTAWFTKKRARTNSQGIIESLFT